MIASRANALPQAGGSCGAGKVDELVGYGAGTTGGGSASGTTVTSCAALKSSLASGGVIKINGMLSGCGVLDVKGSTTIVGVGANSGMTNGGLRLKSANNVILRNLKMKTPPEKKDIIALDKSSKVWIDHCDISSQGISGDKDKYDGLLDITHASDQVTVSWTKFSNHWKGSLIGHSDNNAAEDRGKLRVTYHHNLFTSVNSRTPSVRFGTAHIYSSCYENNPTSGVNSRMGAQVLVESSSFTKSPKSIITNLDSDQEGFALSKDNIFDAVSQPAITKQGNLAPPYKYTPDPASCVCELVKSKAGTGVVS
ncbi:pectin lyase-like protein [Eremomyces bilateralis CBS 781.70]|uniref:Pectin lyase-like protein n=1 Tax=Eremomyces bilateralis CBS 781.70 TaxID=1392243 RepID=A0A6G1FWJ0_9PEZI|nr:pectin lyase-like protein [Eremomyces bilateralis CBS 781.70]KAF1810050.1 pectin lyase-like protein [Eremomyces bilateralis CBS 781.70]